MSKSVASFVACLESLLRGREEGANGIVDEIEPEPGAAPAVAETIQRTERVDALREHAATALAVDVLRRVAGKGADQLDVVRAVELRKVLHAGHEEDRQVAAHLHAPAEDARAADQIAKARVQLRRAAG